MTAQIGDIFKYRKDNYSIAGMSALFQWHPKDYGFEPERCVTACHRGFFCEYVVEANQLFLTKLSINCKDKNYPRLLGKSFDRDKIGRPVLSFFGHRVYSDLRIPIEYTGTILLGNDFDEKYYIGWSVELPHGFKKLLAFEFENGRVVSVQNISKAAHNYRNLMRKFKELVCRIEKKNNYKQQQSLIQEFVEFKSNFDKNVFLNCKTPINDYAKKQLSLKELLKLYDEEGLDCFG